jgi:hypothetical protein
VRRHQTEQIRKYLVFITTVFLVSCGAVEATSLHRPAELLRVDQNRLYFWTEVTFAVNSEFIIEAKQGGQVRMSFSVDSVLGRVVRTRRIADSALALVRGDGYSFEIAFADSLVSRDPLRIGVPAVLSEALKWQEDRDPVGNRDYLFRVYETRDEAEIDLAVGRLHLLILPACELDPDLQREYESSLLITDVEWYLLSDLPDADLYPAALSYCLKGSLSGGENSSVSSVISKKDQENTFPRHRRHARSLFEQMPAEDAGRSCYFSSYMLLTTMSSGLQRSMADCGGEILLTDDPRSASIVLVALPAPPSTSLPDRFRLAQRLVSLARSFRMSWSADYRSRLADVTNSDSLSVLTDLSRRLSAKLQVIPLGVTGLAAVAGPGVHCLRQCGRLPGVENFYLIDRQ